MHHLAQIAALTLGLAIGLPALAAEFMLEIRDHAFHPAALRVPAGERFKLVVANRDPTPEEFESHSLRREKIIPGKSKVHLWIGPLKPGSYPFYGEFHEDSAHGVLVAR